MFSKTSGQTSHLDVAKNRIADVAASAAPCFSNSFAGLEVFETDDVAEAEGDVSE